MASERPAVEDLYDRYLDACLAGELEDPESFCTRHKTHGEELRPRVTSLFELFREQQNKVARPSAGVEPAPGLPFERLGEFRLLRRLDAGGMGMVFLAEQETLGRLVALKVIRPELQESATIAERFRREALAVARLHHKNIVDVYAMGDDQGVRYIAMELVPGRGLDQVLAKAGASGKPVETKRVVRWIRDLARALDYAHDEGVIHRDIKPSNIRIDGDDRPLLLDFGVARDDRWKGQTLTQAFTGSPMYAAPEQLTGATIDGRADVYGLGATLYQCLTGRVPFGEEGTVERVFHRVLTDDPLPPRQRNPAIPRDLEVVILKALEKSPAARYASAGEFANDLDAILEYRPIKARPPGPVERTYKWSRRHPVRATLVLVTIATVAVSLGLWAKGVQERKARARSALRDAREQIAEYRRKREAMKELDAEVTDLLNTLHARYMTEEQDETLRLKEGAVANLRREREEAFYQVLDLVNLAERLDPDLPGLEQVRAELFAEKWNEARVARDAAALNFYEERVARHDADVAAGLRPRHTMRFVSDPPGADVFLFRYQEQAELFAGGERRLVPVPVGGEPPVPPGTWALRVVGAAGGLRKGDVVLRLAGHGIEGTVLAANDAGQVRRLDRLAAIDGQPVHTPFDAVNLTHNQPGSHVFTLERDGETFEVKAERAEALGVRFVTPRAIAEQGNAPARVYRMGEVREASLPPGLSVRTTATPIFVSPECHVGRTPCEMELEEDAFFLLFRREGYDDLRYGRMVRPDWTKTVKVVLCPEGRTLPGWVHVSFDPSFWIMEREVTCAEYREFLNDPETLREIEASEEPIRVPRVPNKVYWERGEDGEYDWPPDWRPDWPILSVSWFDAEAYARWRTGREPGFVYALPTKDEWLAAGHSMAPREFPFGNVFRPKWMKSCYAKPRAFVEPVLSYPVDESPVGVFDMCGSASEWLDGWYRKDHLRLVVGGAWGLAEPKEFELWGLGYEPTEAGSQVGFRLIRRDAK